MTYPIDPAAYWKLLKAIFDDRPKRKRKAEARQPAPRRDPTGTTPLVHRPTLDRAEARGRVIAMIRAADQAIDRSAGEARKAVNVKRAGALTPGGPAGEALGGEETPRR